MAYQTTVDVGNRALQWCGEFQIQTLQDAERAAFEINGSFDKIRTVELRKIPWRWATRRCTLRALTATSVRIIPAAWATATAYTAGMLAYDPGQSLTTPAANGQTLIPLGVNSQIGTIWICVVPHTSSAANAPGNVQLGQPSYWQQYYGPLWADVYGSTVTYSAGELVYTGTLGSTLTFYVSLGNANKGHTPSGGAPWGLANISATTGVGYLQAIYPLAVGVGMSIAGAVRNQFPLPNGYLRLTAFDPKQKAGGWPATTGGLRLLDYEIEGDYLVSANAGPIILRFVADISDVTVMEPLFIETWASSLGSAVVLNLSQDPAKAARVDKAYQGNFDLAALINGFEIGSTEDTADAAGDAINSVGKNKGSRPRAG